MLSVFTTLLYHALIILNNSGEKIVIDVEVAIKIKLFYFADHLFCFYQLVNVTALGLSRTGKPIVKRRTARVKLRAGIKRFQEWIKKSRSRGVSSILRTVSSKFTGHYNYYGVIGNCKSLNQYYHVCRRLLFKWLNRRSQRRSYNWTGFDQVLKMYQIPVPKITERKTKEDKQPMLPFF